MAGGIFVTGGTGYVGRRLLTALNSRGRRVVSLQRTATPSSDASAAVEVVSGDLLQPATYGEALRSCDVVVHLAAATGRASAEQHHRVNALGTETLLEACRHAGVEQILFVSSIAVTFPDLRGYYYAQAKMRAEEAVRRSGMHYLILRPTMILGPAAPILSSLEKLATLPVGVVPGDGRARVQPVHVNDVVACIVAALEGRRFNDEVVELGGGEILSIGELIERIRMARVGKRGPVMRLPLRLFQLPLRIAEGIGLGRVLPITAGQLTSFRFDGVGRPGWLQTAIGRPPSGLAEMLEQPQSAGTSRKDLEPFSLDAEATVFTRHLLAVEVNDYIRAKYVEAHRVLPAIAASGRFDRFLVRFARRGPRFTWLADGYSALFARSSTLRKKLVILLAILESSPPYHEAIDAAPGGGPAPAFVRLAGFGLGALAAIVIGAVVLFPVRAVMALVPGNRR